MTDVIETRAPSFVAFSVIFIALSSLTVGLRLLSRRISTAKFWWDDAIIVISLVLSFGSYAIVFIGLTLEKDVYVSEIHYPINITAIKTSILLFYLRLFGARLWFRNVLYLTEAIVLSWCMATVFPAVFHCKPIHIAWSIDPSEMMEHCNNINAYLIATSVINVILDFWILALPLSIVWTLQMSRKSKASLSGIFLLGAFICGASIARAYTVANVDTADITWSTVDPIIWSNVEISVGIICACLPILRPLVQAVGRKLFGKSSTATWHASQFSQTADEIYGFEQSPKAQSPSMARRGERYFGMPEKNLPALPPAADLRRDSRRAGCGQVQGS
ncbi:MAG: hypothetical protein Q9175_004263 [Cornicularia normoerica]